MIADMPTLRPSASATWPCRRQPGLSQGAPSLKYDNHRSHRTPPQRAVPTIHGQDAVSRLRQSARPHSNARTVQSTNYRVRGKQRLPASKGR